MRNSLEKRIHLAVLYTAGLENVEILSEYSYSLYSAAGYKNTGIPFMLLACVEKSPT